MVSKQILLGLDRQEMMQHGMIKFPLMFLRQEFSPHTYQFIDWHWHIAVQYCYVMKGTIVFQIGKSKETITQGDGLFINTQQVHTCIPIQPEDMYLCLNVSPLLLGGETSALFQNFGAPLLHNPKAAYMVFRKGESLVSSPLTRLEKTCRKAEKGSDHFDLELLADLILLWKETLDLLPEIPQERALYAKENARLQQILLYLNTHYPQPLTLQQIADHVHLSRNECSRFFRNITGQKLFSYLTTLRVAKSVELLLQTDKSITEIAYEVGFGSQSYFTQRFQLLQGIPPSQFRSKFR